MAFDIPRYTLNDGQSVPVIGFGTYPLRGDDGVEAMVHALEAGYRLLDTAVNYGNEKEVGEAVRRSGLPREDVQVTSKIPGRHHAYAQAIEEESLSPSGSMELGASAAGGGTWSKHPPCSSNVSRSNVLRAFDPAALLARIAI